MTFFLYFAMSITRRAQLLISANHRMERFSKNDPWVIFNYKITSSSMTLSEGNHHSFRTCLANERYFHIKSFCGERFSAVYISLTRLSYLQKELNISHNGLFFPQMVLIKLNLYSLRRRSQNCSMEINTVCAKYLDVQLWSTFRNLLFGRIDTYFESCGILRKYVLRNSSQSKKLKSNLPIGQLVSHTSKKATKANRRKEISCSCRVFSWKAHGVGAIVVFANTHSIGSDCHCLFISGHEEITSDYRWYYPPGTQ